MDGQRFAVQPEQGIQVGLGHEPLPLEPVAEFDPVVQQPAAAFGRASEDEDGLQGSLEEQELGAFELACGDGIEAVGGESVLLGEGAMQVSSAAFALDDGVVDAFDEFGLEFGLGVEFTEESEEAFVFLLGVFVGEVEPFGGHAVGEGIFR